MLHAEPFGLQALLSGPPAPMNDDKTSATATLLLDTKCKLAEGIIYDDERNALLFTNILEKKFCKLDLESEKFEIFDLPKILAAFALRPPSESGYLCGWEDGFQFYDLEAGKEIGPMSTGESVNPLGLPDRLNDGRCAPDGKYFVCGGFSGNDKGIKVHTCTTNEDGKLVHKPIIEDVLVANGTCWSQDGKTMYFTNSPTRIIVAYDYDAETGTVGSKRDVFVKPEELGVPDGSIVDAEGFIWSATWRDGMGTGMVQRVDPGTGEVVFTVYLPDDTSQVSCCCLGGPDLDILFITTARENLSDDKEPNAGGIYAVKLDGIKGKKEARFVGGGKAN